jgi:hypothetical protein
MKMKHSELRSTCCGSVTEVPDVRNFWETLKLVTMRYFFIAENWLRGLTDQLLISCLRD